MRHQAESACTLAFLAGAMRKIQPDQRDHGTGSRYRIGSQGYDDRSGQKAMELLPLGPVVLIDTPGLDDEGGLGQKRMEKGLQMLRQTDVLLLVIAADTMVGDLEQDLLAEAKKRGLPYLIVLNKTDLLAHPAQIDEKAGEIAQALAVDPAKVCPVSTDPAQGIGELKERLAKLQPKEAERPLIRIS